MKILIPNLQIPQFFSIAQCLESISDENIKMLFWNVKEKPIIDVFDENNPDIVFLHESQLDSSFAFICQRFYNFKYIVLCTNKAPIEFFKPPEALIVYPSVQHIQKYRTIKVNHIANIASIHNAVYNKSMESDVLVNTTGINIDQNIYNLLLYLTNSYRTKIIGDNKVNLHHYLGSVNIFERANFIKSAKVVVDLGGNDSWDSSYLKTPPLSLGFVAETILQFSNTETLKHNIDSLINKDTIRTKYIEKCYKEVLNNKTSYHFTSEIFNKINEENVSQKLLAYLKELV